MEDDDEDDQDMALNVRFWYACRDNDLPTVRSLTRNTKLVLDVNWRPDHEAHQDCPLLAAITSNAGCIVRHLMALPGLEFNTRDRFGETPLHLACRLRKPEMLRILLSHPQADPSLPNNAGDTALVVAISKQCTDCAGLLLASGRVRLRQESIPPLLHLKASREFDQRPGTWCRKIEKPDSMRELLAGATTYPALTARKLRRQLKFALPAARYFVQVLMVRERFLLPCHTRSHPRP